MSTAINFAGPTYNHVAVFNTQPVPAMFSYYGKSIKFLELNKDGFYSVFQPSPNNPVHPELLFTPTLNPSSKGVHLDGLKGLAVSVDKSSVTFLYTDTRGVYLEYLSPAEDTSGDFTLHVQWKELGVASPDKSHFDNFILFIKKGMITKYFPLLLMKGTKARKAVLGVLDSINGSEYEHYNLGRGYSLHTEMDGSWTLRKEAKCLRKSMCLNQLTAGMLLDK